jgi:prepilin-type processing-associated H-X9-DG protein
MLPYMEQAQVFDAINFQIDANKTGPSSPNASATSLALGVFLCPSDSSVPAIGLGSGTNYPGSRGVESRAYKDGGAFNQWAKVPSKYADFRDGTSTTVAMSEWVMGPHNFEDRDPKGSIFNTPGELIGPSGFDSFAKECEHINERVAGLNSNDKGRPWLRGGYQHTLYNHTLSINDHSCVSGGMAQEGAYSAGSRHPGGAHAMFADGHVRFMAESTSIVVWRALGTRDGGEVIGGAGF